MRTDNIKEISTMYEPEPMYTQHICNCGCSKVTIPYHLRKEQFAIIVHPSFQDHVRFKLYIETEPPVLSDKGWEKT